MQFISKIKFVVFKILTGHEITSPRIRTSDMDPAGLSDSALYSWQIRMACHCKGVKRQVGQYYGITGNS
jgi:hypothetical protein